MNNGDEVSNKKVTSSNLYLSIKSMFKWAVMGQMFTVAIAPILTRLYEPNDFGDFAVFSATIAMLMPFTSFRLEWAIPLSHDDRAAAQVFLLSCSIVIMTSSFTAVGSFAMARFDILPASLRPLWWLIPICFMMSGFSQAANYWLIRRDQFGPIRRARLSQSTLSGGMQILLATVLPNSMNVFSLVVSYTFGFTSFAFIQFRSAWRHLLDGWSHIRWHDVKERLAENRQFVRYSALGSFINGAGVMVPPILISISAGSTSAGALALVIRMVGVPGNLIADSISQPFIGYVAQLRSGEMAQVRRAYVQMTLRLGVIAIAIAVLLATSPWVFPVIFGKNWSEAGWMALAYAPLAASRISFGGLNHLEYLVWQQAAFIWNLVRLIATMATLLLPLYSNASAVQAVAAYSILGTLMYTALFGLNLLGQTRCARMLSG